MQRSLGIYNVKAIFHYGCFARAIVMEYGVKLDYNREVQILTSTTAIDIQSDAFILHH
jgi:hypothetical protein